jgi:uncharacterized protein YhjY with autotransporter beta-barrel domain
MPCQDTPYVKLTYSAEVDADADLTVLLSAVSCGDPQPVPGTNFVIIKIYILFLHTKIFKFAEASQVRAKGHDSFLPSCNCRRKDFL